MALGTFAAQDAAQDPGPDLAPARAGLRLSRREADSDIPPGVPAAQPRSQARRLGGHEEGSRAARPAADPRRHRLPLPSRSMRVVRVAVPVPALEALTYSLPDDFPDPAVGARVLVPLGTRVMTGIVVSGVDVQIGGAARGRPSAEADAASESRRSSTSSTTSVPAGRRRRARHVGRRVLRVRRRRGDRRGDAAAGLGGERALRADHRSRTRAAALERGARRGVLDQITGERRSGSTRSWRPARRTRRAPDARADGLLTITRPLSGSAAAFRTVRVAMLTAQGHENR